MPTRRIDGVEVEELGDGEPGRPGGAGDDGGPWRDGNLVVYRETNVVMQRHRHALPRRCMRCNQPTDRVETARLRWQPKGQFRGVAGGIEVLARTETVEVRLPRCERCRPWVGPRTVSTVFGLLAMGLMVGGLFSPFKGSDPWPLFRCLIAAAACFAVAGVAAVWPREARVVYFERPFVWLSGFSPEYLAGLPPYRAGEGQPSLQREREKIRRELRGLRWPLAVVSALSFAMGCWSLFEWLPVHAVRDSPIITGRVVAREPVKVSLGRPGGRLTVRLDDGAEVHAMTSRKLLAEVPDEVRFRYSGDASRDVFLIDYEHDPFWSLAFFWGAAAVAGLMSLAVASKAAGGERGTE